MSSDSIYRHGFVRIAAAVPRVAIADPAANAAATLSLASKASEQDVALLAFPELGLAGYSAEDLFHQQALLEAVLDAIETIRTASTQLSPVLIVGAPLKAEQGIFNSAVVIHAGEVLGAVPKSYLPEYREFYEKRQFRAARDLAGGQVTLRSGPAPFSPDLLFESSHFKFAVEICEDLWAPIPPSTYAALAGAQVLVNLSASNITIGKSDYRRELCASHSARTLSAYIYTAAGNGESTTDLAWDGQALIYENGDRMAESERFPTHESLISADIDLDRLDAERASMSSWGDSIHDHLDRVRAFSAHRFEFVPGATKLDRHVERFPYVPSNPVTRNARCEEVYKIQVAGLEQRLAATGIQRVLIGISGGLDSTHALIVAARAFDRLGLPRENILAYTMPGFGTSEQTLASARQLMDVLGVSANELDIRPAAQHMLESLGHPAADGSTHYDVTYENVQAGERTNHLFRLANHRGGLVLGTGDLSELALGWSTYGVGDHMSHYNVNASVPKTLIQFLLRWAIDTDQFGAAADQVLEAVLGTAISPELVPGAELQRSEDTVGPYELADFFLYYVLRFGYAPSKVAFLARHAWGEHYSDAEIHKWLGVFLDRFFRTSQFKRSAVPNAPKVGSGGSLSPRGDWRAPSDSSATAWLAELRQNEPLNE
ncbi:MAG: NAD(+) synthase [Solirubrobacterales bacterium]|nr:NAD(+) synthase [Solirubrobacterales bacterium]